MKCFLLFLKKFVLLFSDFNFLLHSFDDLISSLSYVCMNFLTVRSPDSIQNFFLFCMISKIIVSECHIFYISIFSIFLHFYLYELFATILYSNIKNPIIRIFIFKFFQLTARLLFRNIAQ